jgi:hypothetical protein
LREGKIVRKGNLPVEPKTVAELRRLRKLEGVCFAEGGACSAKKTHPVLLRTKAVVFAFIEQNREEHSIGLMCRLYGVTRAGYYAWPQRGPSRLRTRDEELVKEIQAVDKLSRGA